MVFDIDSLWDELACSEGFHTFECEVDDNKNLVGEPVGVVLCDLGVFWGGSIHTQGLFRQILLEKIISAEESSRGVEVVYEEGGVEKRIMFTPRGADQDLFESLESYARKRGRRL
ncbi:MAG: hypothetical protein GF334_12985 [Candidatus Altiarchaeales archaeon]|nr:hypothetical protein [Candidatus Altiarchaeales archaeon]